MEMRPSEKAWVLLATGVIAYDAFCPAGETLSEGVDRALKHPRYRLATIGAVSVVAAHLLNALPSRIDPIHLVFIGVRLNRGGLVMAKQIQIRKGQKVKPPLPKNYGQILNPEVLLPKPRPKSG